jgi:hypothetical protein
MKKTTGPLRAAAAAATGVAMLVATSKESLGAQLDHYPAIMPPAVASDLAHIQQEQVQAEPAEPPQKGIPALPGLRRPQQRLWRRPSPTLVRRRVPASRLPFLLAGELHVVRRKNGSPSTHPLRGPELRALRP